MTPRYEIGAEAYAATQSERDFQRAVVECAELYGWVAVHVRNTVANPYLPDLLLFRDGAGMVAELKRDGREPTARQRRMLDRFAAAGTPTHVWHPSDWGAIEEMLR